MRFMVKLLATLCLLAAYGGAYGMPTPPQRVANISIAPLWCSDDGGTSAVWRLPDESGVYKARCGDGVIVTADGR